MSRRHQGQLPPPFDFDGTLHVLRDNMGRADAMIAAAERMIEESPGGIGGNEEDEDVDARGDSLTRRRNHLAYYIETARLAVRGAIYAGDDLDTHRPGKGE